MYRILLADDEGLVLESVKKILTKNFGNSCQIECAGTGREVIEKAERFRPDIALMDIQMPGINGIDAMEEMRKTNKSIYFIIMSAYDKFDYAKRAIDLGVIDYLMKPANSSRIVEVFEHAISLVERDRSRRREDLNIKEKLEIVVPLIENGLIYTILFHDDFSGDTEKFKQLLEMEYDYGYTMVFEFGTEMKDGVLLNPIGATVKVEKQYQRIREIIKEFFPCIIGTVMANRIIAYMPCAEEKEMDTYEARVAMINSARNLIRKLCQKTDTYFRIGFGAVKELNQARESYREATKALRFMKGTVAHIQDFTVEEKIEVNYPRKIEMHMLDMLKKGNLVQLQVDLNQFFDWMVTQYGDSKTDIRLKVLELVMLMEREAFQNGQMTYHFKDRSDYMRDVTETKDYEQLRTWFLNKAVNACEYIRTERENEYSGIVSKAKKYIDENFNRDITLDEVSQSVNISPYYFSKIFKDETGENFIGYLTNARIEKAKRLLANPNYSIKEICAEVGYGDPNYFSRIFKKYVGATPSEYREER